MAVFLNCVWSPFKEGSVSNMLFVMLAKVPRSLALSSTVVILICLDRVLNGLTTLSWSLRVTDFLSSVSRSARAAIVE